MDETEVRERREKVKMGETKGRVEGKTKRRERKREGLLIKIGFYERC